MDKLVSEVFDLIEKASSKEEKISILKKYDHPPVRAMLSLNYNPSIKLNLPEGDPPYRKEEKPIGYQQTTLLLELRRFYIWMNDNVQLPKVKRETLFIEMLEGLHWTEARLLLAAKDRNLTKLYPSITENLVRESYPDIFPFPPTEEVEEPKKLVSSKKSSASSRNTKKKSQEESVGQTQSQDLRKSFIILR